MPDWITLSKALPQFLYPLNLSLYLSLLAGALILFGRRWKGAFLLFFSLTILFLGSSPLSELLYRDYEQKYLAVEITGSPSADAIVVLGGDVGVPSEPRVESQLHGNRLLHALRLYRANKAPVIMLTGGNVFPHKDLQPEAVYSKEILSEMGVPQAAILIETTSRNTRENAIKSREILGGLGIDRILLVTSGFHLPRAVKVFQKVGFDVVASPSEFSVVTNEEPALVKYWPSVVTLYRSQRLIREYMGLFVYWMRGWV